MKIIKRLLSIAVIAAIACCAVFPASALDLANRKSSLIKYNGQGALKATTIKLHSFDDTNGIEGNGSIDTSDKKEGSGSYRYTFTSKASASFTVGGFDPVKASDCDKLTFRMWVYISDMSLLPCDHESVYTDNDYSGSGTIYFRFRTNGKNWCVNHTIAGKGWQLCEFTLDHDNGYDSSFDANYINGVYIVINGNAGLTVKFDGLEAVQYTNNGYTDDNSALPEGARLISNCEYDGLSGEVISEWFNSDFDTAEPFQGKSSLKLSLDGGDDERLFWGGLNLEVGKGDVLCFRVKVTNIKAFAAGGVIELNEIQDTVEYQTSFYPTLITGAVNTIQNNVWNTIAVPVSGMKYNCDEKKYADRVDSDSITVHHMRICPDINTDQTTEVYIDQIFVLTRDQYVSYRKALRGDTSSTASLASAATSELNSTSDDADGAPMGLIIGIVAAVVAVAAVIIIIGVSSSGKKKAGAQAAKAASESADNAHTASSDNDGSGESDGK